MYIHRVCIRFFAHRRCAPTRDNMYDRQLARTGNKNLNNDASEFLMIIYSRVDRTLCTRGRKDDNKGGGGIIFSPATSLRRYIYVMHISEVLQSQRLNIIHEWTQTIAEYILIAVMTTTPVDVIINYKITIMMT